MTRESRIIGPRQDNQASSKAKQRRGRKKEIVDAGDVQENLDWRINGEKT